MYICIWPYKSHFGIGQDEGLDRDTMPIASKQANTSFEDPLLQCSHVQTRLPGWIRTGINSIADLILQPSALLRSNPTRRLHHPDVHLQVEPFFIRVRRLELRSLSQDF